MSQKTVKVIADDNGKVIRQSKNPEIGYVRVTQKAIEYSARGWLNPKDRSALIFGQIEDLKFMNFKKNQSLSGNIVVKESTEPFSNENPDNDLKIAGDTGIICATKDGEPIYRISFYDPTGQQEDEFIAHANGDAIRAANKKAQEESGANTIVKDEFVNEVENESAEEINELSEDIENVDELSSEVESEVETEDTFEL
jgi:hypothetical protein